jgi:DNA invertase Pin-like site-specific DNA recombinase
VLDTTTPYGKLLLNVLGALAEFERTMILSRTAEGRKAAKAAGVRFGRKPALDKFQMAEAREGRANGESLQSIGRAFNVSHSTILRLGKPEQNSSDSVGWLAARRGPSVSGT